MVQLRCLTLCILIGITTALSARSIQTINEDKAKEVAREQVVWNGRLCPFSTFALGFLQSVYGKSSYKGLSPEQVIYGWLLRPEVWKEEPMIHVPDADLRHQLKIEGEYARFSELFDDTLGYKLNTIEKVGDIILLTRGQLFQPRPADMGPLPAWRVEGEILWNNTPSWAILVIVTAVVALLVFFLRKAMKRSLKTV